MALCEISSLLTPTPIASAPKFVHASGAEFFSEDGRRFVDMNEMRVVLGQGHRGFADAIACAATSLSVHITDRRDELVAKLDDATGGEYAAIHFTSSGSEAIEAAVLVARQMTGRIEVVSCWNSIHGRTHLASTMSGVPKRKTGQQFIAPGVVFIPYPRGGVSAQDAFDAAAQTLKLASCGTPAAFVVEPCQGADNSIASAEWLKMIAQLANESGAKLIIDEVQCGVGRSGEMSLYSRSGIRPDILVLGKALGNGIHISALLMREEPPRAMLPLLMGGSGDDPIACTAACCVLDELANGLQNHVRTIGDDLLSALEPLAARSAVADVRGVGLSLAIDFRSVEASVRAHDSMINAGFLTGIMGHTMFLKPPYVIKTAHVHEFASALTCAVDEIEAGGRW